ncbi:SNF2-related protein [Enterobacter hormaechei]|uniref:SNF2-related protein n=1 Tax=Enterobacter hormaechei TaxID=158836 RepID=UPI00192D05AC|nr:SNF2-related protein [Enterobacter hormaechei]
MTKKVEEPTNDNRERKSHNHSSKNSLSGDHQTTSERSLLDEPGLENSGPLGGEPASGTANAGSERFPGSLLDTDQPTGPGDQRSGREPESWDERTGAAGAPGSQYQPDNFRLSSVQDIGAGGARTKYRDNIAALELLHKLEAEKRQASSAEQSIMARYVGWGGIPQAFDETNTDWESEYNRLLELLPSADYEAARASTLNAHYTAPEVIDGIYDALGRLGVGDGVRILEPAAGIGHFAGKLPFKADMTLNELDSISSRISRQLYPKFTTIKQGFEDFRSPEGYFDIAVGNPPFGDFRVNDPRNPAISRFSIHNFFMAKSLDSLREGGISAMVVSRFFMDSKKSDHREYLADRAHFLGAIRLPNNAFRQNALTEVTTDIVFLQKARPGEEPDRSWVDTGFMRCPKTGESFEVNAWYVNHPEQIIGNMQLESNAFGHAPQCVAESGLDLRAEINNRFSVLPRNCFTSRTTVANDEVADARPEVDFTDTGIKVDSFFVTPDDKIGIRKPDMLGKGDYEYYAPRSTAENDRIRSAIKVRDTLMRLIQLETQEASSQSEMDMIRRELNTLYDRHVKNYDFISSRSNKGVLKTDPAYPLLQSLEIEYDKGVTKVMAEKEGTVPRKPSARKAAIFTKRVNRPNTLERSAETVKDALVICLNESGRVDIGRISDLASVEPEVALRDLHGLVYRNPLTLEYETAETFLSGNVKLKLERTRGIIEGIPALTEQTRDAFLRQRFKPEAAERFLSVDTDLLLSELLVSAEALQSSLPADIDAIDISVQLVSTWLPQKDIQAFIVGHLGIADKECSALYVPPAGKWITKFKGGNKDLLENTWGTQRMDALEILDRLFNNTPVQVKDVAGFNDDGSPIYKVNQEETLAAQGKAEQIANEFTDWIWTDPERRERLARRYNDKFNTHVPGTYDGSHLTLPQASGDIKLRGTQKNAIWRGIQEGCGLGDHVVGAGKTLTAIATIMEQRRMGLVNKPLVIVPNHLLGQWKDEFYKLYPGANVLVAEQSDFEKDNRKRLFATIATGDFDAVILGHSSFKFLALSPEDEAAFLKEQIADISHSLREFQQSLGSRDPSVKQMEKQKKRLEEKIKKISDTGKKDDLLTFDQLGVDALFVDEADEFKNLAIVTSQTRIAGLGNLQGSEKAMDLFLKCRWIQKKRDGKGVYFYTGTPISNSLAELYTLQRYMQYDELKSKNIAAFDSWSSTFGQVVTGWELDATGVNYRLNARFAKFTNVPELMRMYRSFADVVTHADLANQALADGTGRLVPKLKGGKPTSVIVPRSRLQAQFMGEMETVIDATTGRPALDNLGREIKDWNPGSIIYRMENMPKDPRIDNALKVTHDARIAALDFRLVDPHAPDDEGSKVNEAVRRIHKIWEENTYRKGTQLVFCDLSTPKGKFTARPNNDAETEVAAAEDSFSMDEILGESIDPDKFSVYADMRQKLIDLGIPANEIKFIHDATNDQKRQELFRSVNNGDVRILIGSTSKMGAGTNVQRRLVALHDLDCPWRPRDLEQRHGRGIRQGNMFFEQDKENFELEICCYATERTYDARMWQTIEVKARGIEQFRNGSLTDRIIEDIAGDAANAAEMKASATGNQLIFLQVKIDADKRKQETMYRNWQRSRHSLEASVTRLPQQISELEALLEPIRNDLHYIEQHKAISGLDTGVTKFHWRKADDVKLPENAVELLETYLKDKMRKSVDNMALDVRDPVYVGVYRGLKLSVRAGSNAKGLYTHFVIERADGQKLSIDGMEVRYSAGDSFSPTGLFVRLDNLLSDSVNSESRCVANIERLKKDLDVAKEAISGDYPQKAYLDALRQDSIEVMAELKRMQDDEDYISTWQPSSAAFESKPVAAAPTKEPAECELIELDFQPPEETDDYTNTENNPDSTPESQPTGVETVNLEVDLITAAPDAPVVMSSDTTGIADSETANTLAAADTLNPEEESQYTYLTIPFKYGSVIYNTDLNRLQVKFSNRPEKGSDEYRVMKLLSEQGRFSFAPSQDRRWVRRLTDKSAIAAAGILQVELPLPSVVCLVATESVPPAPDTSTKLQTDMFTEVQSADSQRKLTDDEIAAMEITANELFSRQQEGNCSDLHLFDSVRQLAEAGSMEGKYLLSFCYFDGIGVQADPTTAIDLLHAAAEGGHDEARYKVGELFETGMYGHTVDLKQAAHFYSLSDPDFSSPARERVNRLLSEQKLSVMSGFSEILAENEKQSGSEERFFSRMNLLYEKVADAQVLKENVANELENMKENAPVFKIAGQVYDPANSSISDLHAMNSHIMSTIRDAVTMRKEQGRPIEQIAGSYQGMQISVRSVENEMRFTLTGKRNWSPEELVYRKGEREKFVLPEFIEQIQKFTVSLKDELNRCEETLADLNEKCRSEKEKFETLRQRELESKKQELVAPPQTEMNGIPKGIRNRLH